MPYFGGSEEGIVSAYAYPPARAVVTFPLYSAHRRESSVENWAIIFFLRARIKAAIFPLYFRGLLISRYLLPPADPNKAKTAREQFEPSGSDCQRLRSREAIRCSEIDRAACVTAYLDVSSALGESRSNPSRAIISRCSHVRQRMCTNLRIDRAFLSRSYYSLRRRAGESVCPCAFMRQKKIGFAMHRRL